MTGKIFKNRKHMYIVLILFLMIIIVSSIIGIRFWLYSLEGTYVNLKNESLTLDDGNFINSDYEIIGEYIFAKKLVEVSRENSDGYSNLYYKVGRFLIDSDSKIAPKISEEKFVRQDFTMMYSYTLHKQATHSNRFILKLYPTGRYKEEYFDGTLISEGYYEKFNDIIYFYENYNKDYSYYFCIYNEFIYTNSYLKQYEIAGEVFK